MRTSKIISGVIGAIVVAAVLLLVVGMPAGFLTSAIADRVERETGYRLTIGGSTGIGLWPTLNVTMRDVTLEGPNDRESGNHLSIGSLQADLTFSSLWSSHPEITELAINRPDIRIPLRRERRVTPAASSRPGAAANNTSAAPKIQRITVTDGTVTFFNTRDHVEDRIEGIAARATIDTDRHLNLNGKAQTGGHPLNFAAKASMPDPAVERQTIPVELSLDAPGLLQAPLSAEAQLRINGTAVMLNGLSGKMGEDLFDGGASADFASKPLVKVDLDFRRLDIATNSAQGTSQGAQPVWSNDKIELSRLNYVDAQVRLSASELNIGSAHFAPVALEASLATGILKGTVSNVGAYGGQATGTFELDVSPDKPTYAIRCDLNGVRALPLLSAAADFDKLDGRLQAKIDVSSNGQSQQAIMSNLTGNVTANFQDGAIRGLNLAQMIRSLTSGTLSGWQASQEKTTDLSQLSASFQIDKGQATTSDLNLVGPLVKMTGAGTIDVGAKTLALRVDPKLVMTTEGQGRASDPAGFGIPVVIDGPWADPRIYPDVAGIASGNSSPGGNDPSDTLGKLGAALGNLIQQGLNGQNRNPPPNGGGPNDPAQPDQSGRQVNDILKQLFGR
ncbi:AsmA family protein [Bradyrhizobium erythrophlei]|uniref:AsmA protein n=1 Tax=Bradyrhizobium erythrophlei TaxID=1437360 RepID=A0A1M7TSG1_9BRAD|nr:AsmA family protein [Bradyrhizobium erythrophlei]SHN73671.1 AsmA protein [Bradyrhizobium erythrophlei]